MKLRLLIIGLLINFMCFGQTDAIQKGEKDLLECCKADGCFKYFNDVSQAFTECIDSFNKMYTRSLTSLLLLPGAENYDFNLLRKNGTTIIRSVDGKVRIFSWEQPTFGSTIYKQAAVQYIDDEGKLHCWEDKYTPQYDSVVTVEPGLYLLFGFHHDDSRHGSRTINSFQIDGKKASMKKKLFEQDAGFESVIGVWFEYDDKRRARIKFEYNPENKQLCYTDIEGKKTCLVYDGKYFRKTKN